MGVTEIPKAYRYTCDCCGQIHIQENAAAHYSNSRPPTWGSARMYGTDGGTGKAEMLLCFLCSTEVEAAIVAVLDKHQKPSTT